jgi:F0F1-type ATP synthase membrane subunit b/b'
MYDTPDNFGANKNGEKSQASQEFAKLREEAKDILSRIKQVGEKAGETIEEEALSTLERITSESSEKVKEYVDEFETYIKRRPIFSAMVAFSAGILMAKVISWTSHR